MAAVSSVYRVTTAFNPGVPVDVDQAEYEGLTEQGVVQSLISVTVPIAKVLIVDAMPVVPPPIGTVIFNRSVAS